MPIANTSKSNNNASHDFSKGFHNWLVCLFRDVWRRPKVQVVRRRGSSIPAEKILVKNGTSGLRRLLLVQTNLPSSTSSSNQPSFPRQLARPIHQLEDAYLMHCKGAQNMENLPAFNWSQNIPSKPSLSYLAHFLSNNTPFDHAHRKKLFEINVVFKHLGLTVEKNACFKGGRQILLCGFFL